MPLQDPGMKPPDETDVLSCSRSASDRRQKSNVNADQVLKCPRCESMNTKFCYYNNYSLTQPRHFCKNCRRYWTKGGALRNVPVGGGCRKNKRIKQRSVDPNSLVSLDEGTSNMLASINGSNCTPLLPNFSGPSSSSFVDLANDNHRFGLTFARIQESIRLGEHSGAVSSNQSAYGLGAGSSQVNPGMLNASCGQPSLVNSLPTGFEGGLLHLSYPNGTVKMEPSNALYNGSDLSSLFETPAQMAGVGTAALPSLEDQLSSYSVPVEIYNGCGAETQFRLQPQKLAMQLMHDVHIGDQRQMLAPYEDERNDNLRRMKGKSIHPCLGEGRSHPDWQGVPENLFETAGDSNLWSNTGWPELHALAGSAAGSMM